MLFRQLRNALKHITHYLNYMLLHFQYLWSQLLTHPNSHYYSSQVARYYHTTKHVTYLFDQIKMAKT